MSTPIRSVAMPVFALLLVIFMSSCTSPKELAYFQNLPQQAVIDLPPLPREERTIENGDELSILFSAKDNEAASFFNRGGISSTATMAAAANAASATGGGATSAPPGSTYLVDNSGFLEFPMLGAMKVTGLTSNQLRVKLLEAVAPYLKDPILEVKFTVFRISILGEVRTPGTHVLSMQRTTIYEALASAGDLTPTAQRYDIELYRDYNGQRRIYKFDLRNKDVLSNPDVFQMRHNDVLYVKPLTNVIARENAAAIAGFVSIGLTLITLAITIAK